MGPSPLGVEGGLPDPKPVREGGVATLKQLSALGTKKELGPNSGPSLRVEVAVEIDDQVAHRLEGGVSYSHLVDKEIPPEK